MTKLKIALVCGMTLGALVLLASAGLAGGNPCNAAGALCPDMKMVVPKKLHIQNQQQREILRFTSGFANDGPGPLWIEPKQAVGTTGTTVGIQVIFDCTDPVSQEQFCSCFPNCVYVTSPRPCPGVACAEVSEFVFHANHNHWHILDVARYEVRFARDDGTGGRFGAVFQNDAGPLDFKVGVCMFDDYHLDCSSASTSERNMWSCEVGPQGQTGRNDPDVPGEDHAGWVDQYHQSLDGQDLDITGAPVGVYYLVVTMNPAGRYIELNTSNNTSWTSFRVTRDSMGNPQVTEVTSSACANIGLCGGCTKNG